MSESQKTYSRRQLISVAEVANAFALSRDIAGLEAVQQLAECVLQGKLCADLYPPHQYWQLGGQSDLIGKPAQNSVQVWRSLAAKSVERHMSDKDDFNYPPSASTYHLLADDVFAFARTGGLSARAAEAMLDLSVRHKAELATPKSSEPQTKFAPSHQAAASVVDESASNGPLPLTTGDIAFCFDGIRWNEQQWRKPLGDKPKWLQSCVAIPGQRGVSETRWNPVLMAAALVRDGHAQARSIRARFQTKPQLKDWLEAWKTYEADNFDAQ